MNVARIGVIGVGSRGTGLLGNLLDIDGVEIKAICDIVPDRVKKAQERLTTKGRPEPAGYSKNESDFENLCRREDLLWFYQEGASHIFPDAWESYLEPIPPSERGDMMKAYYKRLTSKSAAVRNRAAKAWSIWEGSTSKLRPDPALIRRFGGKTFADAFARIEAHYFVNGGFLDPDDQLLRNVRRIRHIPGVIV